MNYNSNLIDHQLIDDQLIDQLINYRLHFSGPGPRGPDGLFRGYRHLRSRHLGVNASGGLAGLKFYTNPDPDPNNPKTYLKAYYSDSPCSITLESVRSQRQRSYSYHKSLFTVRWTIFSPPG